MLRTILLNHDENVKKVEDEEKTIFLRNILIEIGIPIHEFWTHEGSLSIEERINLRKILHQYNITVIDDISGEMQIYAENKLIAEWRKSTYKLKKDLREINPKKQLYLEMQVDTWSLFEQELE